MSVFTLMCAMFKKKGAGEKDALSVFPEISSLLLNSLDAGREEIISPCCLE